MCLDNAACETVFSKLKAEIGTDNSYHNLDELSKQLKNGFTSIANDESKQN